MYCHLEKVTFWMFAVSVMDAGFGVGEPEAYLNTCSPEIQQFFAFWPVFTPSLYTTDTDKAAQQAVVAAGHKLVRKQMGILNTHLRGRDWILGAGRGQRSVIDAYSFPMIRWGIKLLPGGIADYPAVQALHDRLAADPLVQKVLADEEAA